MHVVGWTPGSGAGKGSSHAKPGRAGTPSGRNAQNWSFTDASVGDIDLECKGKSQETLYKQPCA